MSDPDAGDAASYAFAGGPDDGSLRIEGSTLKTATPFDFETKPSYAIPCAPPTTEAPRSSAPLRSRSPTRRKPPSPARRASAAWPRTRRQHHRPLGHRRRGQPAHLPRGLHASSWLPRHGHAAGDLRRRRMRGKREVHAGPELQRHGQLLVRGQRRHGRLPAGEASRSRSTRSTTPPARRTRAARPTRTCR